MTICCVVSMLQTTQTNSSRSPGIARSLLRAAVAKAMERTAHSHAKARRTIEVPVRHLKVA